VKLLDYLRLITAASGEAQLSAAAVFALMRGIRAVWPKAEGEELPSDRDLVGLMRGVFSENEARRLELKAELEANRARQAAIKAELGALNPPPPADAGSDPQLEKTS
jgi:hypothetical protein